LTVEAVLESRVVRLVSFAGACIVILLALRALLTGEEALATDETSRPALAKIVKYERVAGEPLTIRLEPISASVQVGSTQTWFVTITNEKATPLTDCRVTFDGTMPEHGHGLPTTPRVAASPAAGRYPIEGVRFSMGGYWQLDVGAKCGDSVGHAAFDLRL
jgi:hypothetical protein